MEIAIYCNLGNIRGQNFLKINFCTALFVRKFIHTNFYSRRYFICSARRQKSEKRCVYPAIQPKACSL